MKNNNLFDFLMSEADHPFSGWDFSYINDRLVNAPLTWSYLSKILPFVRASESLLDMGTGGGEFLASLAPLPKFSCATEGYAPNVEIAKKKLEPLGVRVVSLKDNQKLPFENESFELIINRHEYYNLNEVYRTLKHKGTFITQQVGDKNNLKLKQVLGISNTSTSEDKWNLEYAVKELKASGFEILEGYEDIILTRIFDVGAIVYFLKALPWEFPDFTIKNYYEELVEINETIIKNGYLDLESNEHRFFIKAQKGEI